MPLSIAAESLSLVFVLLQADLVDDHQRQDTFFDQQRNPKKRVATDYTSSISGRNPLNRADNDTGEAGVGTVSKICKSRLRPPNGVGIAAG